MFEEEELPRKSAKSMPDAPIFEGWDVDDMQAYIGWLKGEITRAEAEIEKRGSAKSAADAFFKK